MPLLFGWTPMRGWGTLLSALGAALEEIPAPVRAIAAAAAYATTTVIAPAVGVAAGAAGGAYVFLAVSTALRQWAFTDGYTSIVDAAVIARERQVEGIESNSLHIAICGPTGSGKSSLINALRGIPNGNSEAARTGVDETTTQRTKYRAHENFPTIFLHDCPGAGTMRSPADNYYQTQKLYLFHTVFIVQGTRFGTIEIEIIKSCIRQGQHFFIIRSQSDTAIRNIIEDEGVSQTNAKEKYQRIMIAAIDAELRRAKLPEEQIEEMLRYCVLVNKNDLRSLTIQIPQEWPSTGGEYEIHERSFLRWLQRLSREG